MELKDNYEVWAPCKYRGMIVFIDLLVENGSRISLFEFSDRVKNIERSAKLVKLKTEIFSQEKSPESRSIRPYLVLKEGKKNRKTILQQKSLLEGQPFEVLFLGDGKVESFFREKERISGLFRAKNAKLREEALHELMVRPNHAQIEAAISHLDNLPDKVGSRFIEQIDKYIKRNGAPPRTVSSLVEDRLQTPPDEVKHGF